jgi:hypothetical protein
MNLVCPKSKVKVKLSLCLCKHHARKKYGLKLKTHILLALRIQASGQVHVPTSLTTRKEQSVTMYGEAA